MHPATATRLARLDNLRQQRATLNNAIAAAHREIRG